MKIQTIILLIEWIEAIVTTMMYQQIFPHDHLKDIADKTEALIVALKKEAKI